jgi:2-aminoadipate transaminase
MSQTDRALTPIVLTRGVPPNEAFPTAQIAECFAAALENDPNVVLQYGQHGGYLPLRQLLAEEYGVGEGEIMVANGSLQIQDLLAQHLVRPGMTVISEQPSYDRAIATFRRHAKQVVGVPLEHDGINVEQLEALVRAEVPAFVYLIPDFQNPSGATLSLRKRQRIVELANTYDFWVLEDVPYRKLRYQGEEVPLLRDIDPRRVVTLSSFSKLLSPGMRVGYMVGPEEIVAAVTRYAENMYLSPVLPTQAAVAEYIKRGWLAPNIENLRALYRPRWRAMLDATRRYLPDAEVMEPDGGFFVGVMLPPEANTSRLVERAKEQNLSLTAGASFFADSAPGDSIDGEKFVRLPFCAVTPEQIDEGVRRLATLL